MVIFQQQQIGSLPFVTKSNQLAKWASQVAPTLIGQDGKWHWTVVSPNHSIGLATKTVPTSVSTYLFFFQLGNKKQLGPKKQRRHNVVRYTFCLFGSEERVKEISAQISSALADEQFTRDLKAFKSPPQLHQTIVTKLQLELTALPPEVILPDLGSDSQKTTEKDDPSSVKKQAITGLAVADAAELPVKTQKPTTVDSEKEITTNQRQDKEYFVTKDFLLPQEGEEGLTEQLGETSLGEDHFVTSHPDFKATIEETTDDISEYLLRFYYRDQKLSDHFTRTKYFVHSVPEPFLILREFGSYQTKTIDSQLATHQDDPFVIHQSQLVDDYDLTPKGVSDFQDQTYHAVDLQSTPDNPPFDYSLSDLQQESLSQTQSFPAESLVEFQQEQLEVEEEQEVIQQEVVSDDLLADDLEEQLPASSLFTESQAITAEPESTPLITSSKPSSDQLELITDQHHLPQQEQLEVPLPTDPQLPAPILELPEPLEKNQKQQIILLCGSEPFPGANQAIVTSVQRLNDFDNFAVDFAGVINGKKVKLTESRIRRANLVLILPGARKLRQFPAKLRVQVAYENLLNHSLPTIIQSLMVVYKRLNQPIPTQWQATLTGEDFKEFPELPPLPTSEVRERKWSFSLGDLPKKLQTILYQFKTKPVLQQLTSPPVPLVSEEEEVDSQKDHFTNTSQLSESTDSVVSDGDDFTPGVYTTLVTKPLDLTPTEVSSDSKDFCATEQWHFITTVSQENQSPSQGKKLLTIHPQIKKLITVCRKILGNCDPRRLLKKTVIPNSSAAPKKPTSQLFITIMGLKKNPKLVSYYGLLMKRVKTFRAKKPFSSLVKKKVKESSADQPPPFSQAN